jgi:predicted metal-dependent hydrolase
VIAASPWTNPSPEQELAWQAARVAALQAHRQAVAEVLRIRDLEARRRYLSAYRERWGQWSAAGLEMRLMKAWQDRLKNV